LPMESIRQMNDSLDELSTRHEIPVKSNMNVETQIHRLFFFRPLHRQIGGFFLRSCAYLARLEFSEAQTLMSGIFWAQLSCGV